MCSVVCLSETARADYIVLEIFSIEYLVDVADKILLVTGTESADGHIGRVDSIESLKSRFDDDRLRADMQHAWPRGFRLESKQSLMFLSKEERDGKSCWRVFKVVDLLDPLDNPYSAAVTKTGKALDTKNGILEFVRARIAKKYDRPTKTEDVACTQWDPPDSMEYRDIDEVIVTYPVDAE